MAAQESTPPRHIVENTGGYEQSHAPTAPFVQQTSPYQTTADCCALRSVSVSVVSADGAEFRLHDSPACLVQPVAASSIIHTVCRQLPGVRTTYMCPVCASYSSLVASLSGPPGLESRVQ